MVAEEGFIAIAYKEGESKAEAALQSQRRLTVMHGWHGSVSLNLLINMANLPKKEVVQLIAIFDKVKNYCNTTEAIDRAKLKKLSGLGNAELDTLLALLKK